MQRFRFTTLLAVILCGPAQVQRASAHHSVQAQFDINSTVTVTGTVAKVEFINPHSYLTVDVKEADGTVTRWAFEMLGAGRLRRDGLSRADRGGLKPGDELTVVAMPARNGSTTGALQILKMADGREFNFTADPTGQSTGE